MECIVQYLDDIEDIFYAAALLWERVRRAIYRLSCLVAAAALQVLGIYLALVSPPLAIAFASLLLVGLLFGSVLSYRPQRGLAA